MTVSAFDKHRRSLKSIKCNITDSKVISPALVRSTTSNVSHGARTSQHTTTEDFCPLCSLHLT